MAKEFELATAFVQLKTKGQGELEKSLEKQRQKVEALSKGMASGEFAKFTAEQTKLTDQWNKLTTGTTVGSRFADAFSKGGMGKGLGALMGGGLGQSMLGGALAGGAASGGSLMGMLSGAGSGAAMAGGPWGMIVAAGIQGFQMVFEFGKQVFNKILGLVQVGNPVVAERFNLAMQDLYGVIGFKLSPIINSATNAVRRFADAFLNSPAAEQLQRLSMEVGRSVEGFGKLLVESGAIDTFGMALKLATEEVKFFTGFLGLLNKKPGGKDGETIGASIMKSFNPFLQIRDSYDGLRRLSGKSGKSGDLSSVGAGGGGEVGFSDILAAKLRFQTEALKNSAYGGGMTPEDEIARNTAETNRLLRAANAAAGNPFSIAALLVMGK